MVELVFIQDPEFSVAAPNPLLPLLQILLRQVELKALAQAVPLLLQRFIL